MRQKENVCCNSVDSTRRTDVLKQEKHKLGCFLSQEDIFCKKLVHTCHWKYLMILQRKMSPAIRTNLQSQIQFLATRRTVLSKEFLSLGEYLSKVHVSLPVDIIYFSVQI